MNVAVIHGPNLNLLGEREPEVYGRTTLDEINAALVALGLEVGADVSTFQSNHEGAIVDELHRIRRLVDAVIINPAAYTHYSIAIRDAISAIAIPVVEVHLSDIAAREEFRRRSFTGEVCLRTFSGKGIDSYLEALTFVVGTQSVREKHRA